jgi:predicted carbohydrate-binding protein with CBM5 and CBM33 domain
MTRRARWKLVAAAVVLAAVAAGVLSWGSREAEAHGSTSVPASRVYSCRFEQPDNPMCAAAWSADSQALYDWMEVNIPDADGRHQELIPDGELCSAGRDKYAAFDQPGDWPVTQLQPNSSGQHEVVYTNTAPHATAYYRLMLTREGFDARTDTLNWSDLELVYDSGPLAAAQQNRFAMSLPARSEPAVLYVIWQRSDSPEAFYSCSDVTIAGGGAAPTTAPSAPGTTAPPTTEPTTTEPPSTEPTTTVPGPTQPGTSQPGTTQPGGLPSPSDPPSDQENPFSPVAGIETAAATTADWDGGYCTEIGVENTTAAALTWEVHYAPGGSIASTWNAVGEEQHHAGHEGHLAFVGEDWNERLAPGQRTTFGMCVDE